MDGKFAVMMDKPTAFGRQSQPHSVENLNYRIRMTPTDSKAVLWKNVQELMKKRYGEENQTKLAKDVGFGTGTAIRLKAGQTSVGIDIIDRLAQFFGLQPWQLLVPGLKPDALPALGGDASGWPMQMISKERFVSLSLESRIFAEGYLRRLIEEREAEEANGKTGTQ